MTPNQFKDAIEELGLSQRASGRLIGKDERTIRRWCSGDSPIDESAAILLWLMVDQELKPAYVEALIDRRRKRQPRS